MGIESGRAAMDMAGVEPDDIELLVVATTTPDQRVPGTSAVIHAELGLGCGAFDLNAACAGFTYGFVTATSIIDAPGGPERVLLIGADSLSPLTDWTDRGTAILFADGGGAVVLERVDRPTLLGWDLGADGKQRRLLMGDHDSTITMEGREVFKVAVRAVSDSVTVDSGPGRGWQSTTWTSCSPIRPTSASSRPSASAPGSTSPRPTTSSSTPATTARPRSP